MDKLVLQGIVDFCNAKYRNRVLQFATAYLFIAFGWLLSETVLSFLELKEHTSTDDIGFVAEKVCGIFVRVQILAVNRLMPPSSFHRHYSMGWPHMVIIVRLLLEELSVWMLSSQMMLQLTLSKDSCNGNTSLLLVDNV